MSMILVLPIIDAVGSVLSIALLPTLNDLQSTPVALSIPKVKFESTYDDSLKAAIAFKLASLLHSVGDRCVVYLKKMMVVNRYL